MLDTLRQDFRYAARGLRAKPGFTAAVVLTLALGIGANAAMFGIVDRMLFRPPPYLIDPATAHRVYTMQTYRGKESESGGEYARYVDLARWTRSFSNTAIVAEPQLAVGTGDASTEMRIGAVNASFFKFFDAPPVIGRYFTAGEDATPSGSPVVVLSYATWQAQFGSSADALGSRVQIGPVTYTVIGVAPQGFVGLWPESPPAYFIPITSYAAATSAGAAWLGKKLWWTTYSWGWADMIARRRPGVSIEAANADLTNAFKRSYQSELLEQHGAPPASITRPHAMVGSILPERGPHESSTTKVATWVAGVALIVLLIACANVANLLLARALRRRREIALRLALGISRGRLVAQLLTESFVLAVLGGVAGLVIAHWGGTALRVGLMPKSAPVATLGDARTILFAGCAALAVGLLTGIAPLLQTRRANLTNDLKAGSREGVHHKSRTRTALLVLQGALSVLLLVGAGLFVRSLQKVETLHLGYDADPVLLVGLNMRGVQLDTAHTIALRRQLLQTATSLPEVSHASLQNGVPFWSHSSTSLFVQGIDTVAKLGRFEFNSVTPDYFATLGTKILRGRGLMAQDRQGAVRVMVVSEAMGQRLWPGEDPIGKCVRRNADTMPCTYVVGVAENITQRSFTDDPSYYYYLPADQNYTTYGGVFVRVRGNARRFEETLRRRLQAEMPGASYVTITPLADIVGSQRQSWKLGATMFAAFGLLALVLAAIGLYSVIAYDVAQRTHELGVRVALGAQVRDVVRMVVAQGLGLGAIGVGIGTVLALWAGHWVGPLLFKESPKDPLVFGTVVSLLLGVAVVASWIPALRAARVDPQVALRAE